MSAVRTIYGEEIIGDYELPNSGGKRRVRSVNATYIVSRDGLTITEIERYDADGRAIGSKDYADKLKTQDAPEPQQGGRFAGLDIEGT